MRLVLKRCHTCHALGVGPKAVKLWPFEDRMFCKTHYQDPLTWHESRGNVVAGLGNLHQYQRDMIVWLRRRARGVLMVQAKRPDWRGFIEECAGMAEFGLLRGDQKIFVRYFSRAVWAWSLSQEQEQV